MSARRDATPGVGAQEVAELRSDPESCLSVGGGGVAVKPVRKVFDFRCEIAPPDDVDREFVGMPLGQMADAYEVWVEDFNRFLRQHRDQNGARVRVIRDIRDACSACGAPWETDTIDGVLSCANCGLPVAVKGMEG